VLLGRIEQAERSLEEARELAKSLSHPASMGSALGFSAMTFQISRDATRALHYAESAIGHCEKAGLDRLLWKSTSMVVRGWSLAILESDDAAFTEIERGIRQWTASGTTFCYPYLLGLLADAQGHLGRYDEAYSTALKALESSEQIGELWWRPELYRIIGHFQENISRDLVGDAETSFQNSIRSARGIDAKTLELRGSLSLARLWHSQGKTAEARDLLASVYGWFTEGFDTADLKEAKALLDALD
jgi:predicted ATPase